MDGKDIFAQAETGSGKTGSFAIPILEQIIKGEKKDTYVVLSPTRELAQQTAKVFNMFGDSLGIKSVCLIGGEDIEKQKKLLEDMPQVFVATPGRMCDIVKQKIINLTHCKGLVFDEADRLFDMGFKKEIEYILNKIDKSRQLIMVSATSNMDLLQTAYKYHSDPIELKLNADDLFVDKINHSIAMIDENEKMPYLVNLMRNHEDAYSIIFCNTQFQTHLVAAWLEKMDFKVKAISGKLAQNRRTSLMEDFRSKKITTLVCTDVAARGLDIKDVNLVVNYDLPNEAASYVHRIGRTGRAGKEGKAISFCAFKDCENLDAITEYVGMKVPKLDIEETDFAKGLAKKPYLDKKTLKVIQRDSDKKTKTREPRETKPKTSHKKTDASVKASVTKSEKRETPMAKSRVFTMTTTSTKELENAAMKYFSIDTPEMLDIKTIEKGAKKFIIFGARKNKFEVRVKAIYKKLLLPFFIELFQKMNLKVYVRVSFKEPNVRVNFSGKDAGLLLKNKFELKNSIENVAKIYLGQKIEMPRGLKFFFRVDREKEERMSDEDLIALAKKTMEKAQESGSETIAPLNPAHRRIIHQFVNDSENFKSSSVGDGRMKKIEISHNA